MLVHALAGVISPDKNLSVKLPAVYNPSALSDAGSGILKELAALPKLRVTAQEQAPLYDKLFARFTEAAKEEKDPEKKEELLKKAEIHKNAADAWKTSMGLYDAFFSKLTTTDDKGALPLANVVREGVIDEALANGDLLLLVKLQKSGGSYYTKKNMWTFFGGMPYYHMGGVVASFVLLDGKTGTVQKSGIVPVHGGFIEADKLRREIDETP
jgi:hypothetical protein